MPGPSIVVRVLGDLTGLGKSMDASATKAESTSSKIRSAFSGMFSSLNATGVLGPLGGMFNQVDMALAQMDEHGKELSTTFLALGGVMAGVGAGLTELGSADQAAQQQLAQAIENTGASWSQYSGQVDKTVHSMEQYGHTAADTQNALATLTEATNDPTEALQNMGLAANLAASQHENLTSAANQLARAINGGGRLLKEYGITVPKVGSAVGDFATKADQTNYIIGQLDAKLKGEASAASDTFMGHVHALSAEVEDATAQFGQRFGPAITALGSVVTVVSGAFKIYEAVTKSATVATEEQTVAQAELDTAMDANPVGLMIAALAALGVAAYEIARHWHEIWAGIKAAMVDVWDWLKNNWQLVLGFILGPIGLAVAVVNKYRDQIWDFLKDIYNWLDHVWQDVEGFITAPFKAAIDDINKIPGIGIVKSVIGDITHLSVPFLAQGGVVTQSGLIYAHAGEAVTPIPNNTFGPAVNIEYAQFNDPVDIDLLSKKIEFALAAGQPV